METDTDKGKREGDGKAELEDSHEHGCHTNESE